MEASALRGESYINTALQTLGFRSSAQGDSPERLLHTSAAAHAALLAVCAKTASFRSLLPLCMQPEVASAPAKSDSPPAQGPLLLVNGRYLKAGYAFRASIKGFESLPVGGQAPPEVASYRDWGIGCAQHRKPFRPMRLHPAISWYAMGSTVYQQKCTTSDSGALLWDH